MAFLVTTSIVGVTLINVLVLQSNIEQIQVPARNSLVGGLYSLICLLGIGAVLYPAKCRGLFQRMQNPLFQADKPSSSLPISGHHPDCQNFEKNRIKVGARGLCAACSGLLIGGIIALIGVILQFFVGLSLVWESIWLLMLGEVGMVLGLAQIKFAGIAKVIVNMFFVVSSFLTLAEVDILGGNILVDVYMLGLIAFLLWLRILLSEWNNQRTCQMCRSCFY